MSVNVCPEDIFCTAKQFVTKLGMMMHHYQPDCRAGCVQGQGYNETCRWYFVAQGDKPRL